MDSERTLPAAAPAGAAAAEAGAPARARVAEAVARLASLRELPLDEHPPVLRAVHDRLREILGEPGGPGEGR
jgi:hypothetical protein